jgi:hypothetical protein
MLVITCGDTYPLKDDKKIVPGKIKPGWKQIPIMIT